MQRVQAFDDSVNERYFNVRELRYVRAAPRESFVH